MDDRWKQTQGKRHKDPNRTKKHFGFKISPKDFGGDKEKTAQFFKTIEEVDALSSFTKEAIIEKVLRVAKGEQIGYKRLMEYISYKQMNYEELIKELETPRENVNNEELKKELKTKSYPLFCHCCSSKNWELTKKRKKKKKQKK
jgi:hypothetical protein